MITHDVLAFAIASEAVRQIRRNEAPWAELFSPDVFATSSRVWPLPDFVIRDSKKDISVAGEFKPPDQTKREYLTGLGQALAYTRDFHYALLVVPLVADDGYAISKHVTEVLKQKALADVPIGLIEYDPSKISSTTASFTLAHPLRPRVAAPEHTIRIDESFWAKWRDASPTELGRFLEHLYEQGLPRNAKKPGSIRDRAFAALWDDIGQGRVQHWGGEARKIKLTEENRVAWGKNYRNFVAHIGWIESDGKLTHEGLEALRIVHRYGSDSQLFRDHLAKVLLSTGKHLVLVNAINEFQDSHGAFADEATWLDAVESHLEDSGLLKRNEARHLAAKQKVERGFLKAEKTIWRNLGLVVPRGGRVYHPGRGFVFNWSRVTALLTQRAA